MSPKTYRNQFSAADKALKYEHDEYRGDSYAQVLWRIEQMQLTALLREFRRTHGHIDYLDFACGTGRVISFMQDKVDTVTGIEISEPMAELGRAKLRRGAIYCTDITEAGRVVEGTYDFITAFRFVLNAEPSLRLTSLKALAARLKNDGSWLVFNNHGNLLSHKLLFWPFHTLRHMRSPDRRQGNYMTHTEVRNLARMAGLTIERVLGCGVIGAKAARIMNFDRTVALESALASMFISRFGSNQMYVARRLPKS